MNKLTTLEDLGKFYVDKAYSAEGKMNGSELNGHVYLVSATTSSFSLTIVKDVPYVNFILKLDTKQSATVKVQNTSGSSVGQLMLKNTGSHGYRIEVLTNTKIERLAMILATPIYFS